MCLRRSITQLCKTIEGPELFHAFEHCRCLEGCCGGVWWGGGGVGRVKVDRSRGRPFRDLSKLSG